MNLRVPAPWSKSKQVHGLARWVRAQTNIASKHIRARVLLLFVIVCYRLSLLVVR
jgi:hypothetical protein